MQLAILRSKVSTGRYQVDARLDADEAWTLIVNAIRIATGNAGDAGNLVENLMSIKMRTK